MMGNLVRAGWMIIRSMYNLTKEVHRLSLKIYISFLVKIKPRPRLELKGDVK